MNIELRAPATQPSFWSGYEVIPYERDTHDPESTMVCPYKVRGPRKTWLLVRNVPNPAMLFPVPEDFLKGSHLLKGFAWFKEIKAEDGQSVTLHPCQ